MRLARRATIIPGMGSTVGAAISAIAATVAAALAAVNLYLSGRREHVRWARAALDEVLVAFLDASFQCKDCVKSVIRTVRQGGSIGPAAESQRDEAIGLEVGMRSMQTRLRLLATPEVVDAAHQLRITSRNYIRLLDADPDTMLAQDAEMRRRLWSQREELISAARKAMALPRSWLRPPVAASATSKAASHAGAST